MVELIRKLAKLVTMRELYFESAEARRLLYGQPPKDVNVDVAYSAEGKVRGGKTLDAIMSFTVKVIGLDSSPIAKVSCKIRIAYLLADGAKALDLTDESATAFAKVNGIYNAHPFFREYLQGACARLGLPPVLAPLLLASDLFERVKDEEEAAKPADAELGKPVGETDSKSNVVPLKPAGKAVGT